MIDISIIIPVYNAGEFIKNSVECIINYNTTNLCTEIILVNDGSTDNSLEILNELKNRFDFIVIINQENKGAGGARNAGLSKAKGNRIWFIDADDNIEPKAFDIIKKALENAEDETIIFNYNRIIRGEKSFNKIDSIQLDKCVQLDFIEFNKRNLPCYLWIVLYKNSIIQNNSIDFIDNIKNLEDLEFNLKYFPLTSKIIFINTPIYNYNLNENSTTQNRSKKNLIKLADDSFTVHSSIYNKYKAEPNSILKNYYLYNLLVTEIGFFYTLLSFDYNFKDVNKYFILYNTKNLIPILKHKDLSLKYMIFSKIVNLGFLPFYLFKIFFGKILIK